MAVVAGLLLSPRASEAGCGDYVWVRGQFVPMTHYLPDQPASTEGSPADSANHGAPQRPCRGPGCSDGSAPPEAPVPGVVVSLDRWAMAPGDTLSILVCCDNLLAEPVDLVTDGFRSSILRPPR